MNLETKRLTLIPLTAPQLRFLCSDMASFERELNCRYDGEPLEETLLKILQGQVEPTEQDPENALYHTFWMLLRREDRVVVGSADFKNIPSPEGAVEIGYGLGKSHEHQGFMTEAIEAMCKWALEQPSVTRVVAETLRDNLPSQRILQRLGFLQDRQEENLWWRLENKASYLQSGERLEPLGPNADIIVSKEHSFNTDTLLLADFSMPKPGEACLELGTGCGTIPALWSLRSKAGQIVAAELQEKACAQAERTFAMNGMSNIRLLRGDLRKFRGWGLPAGGFDLCACNPPYKASGAGDASALENHLLARHEVSCTFEDVAEAASWLLRWGGRFCCCQRPERLADVLTALRSFGLEPKRMRMVQQRPGKAPFLFLLQACRGGKPGMAVDPVLMVEDGQGGFSAEMLKIYGDYKAGCGTHRKEGQP